VKLDLGRVGVWSNAPSVAAAAAVRDGLPELEELGYRTLWYPEGGAKESFSTAALLLSWSERLVVATGIANIHARDPMACANGARALADAHPGRFVLGLGVSHAPSVAARGGTYDRPLATMRAYLDAMERAPYNGHEPEEPAPRLLAGLGPRMLDLAAERTAGAHPYFVPVEHTAFARERLGPEPMLAVEQAVVLETDAARARELARPYLAYYVGLDNYANNLRRLGWADDDLTGSGSDRLLDALVAWGDAGAVRERVRAHFEAGADHVCIQPLPAGHLHLEQLRELAPALLDL
jgi:probable F420-dependent oxidoreductase